MYAHETNGEKIHRFITMANTNDDADQPLQTLHLTTLSQSQRQLTNHEPYTPSGVEGNRERRENQILILASDSDAKRTEMIGIFFSFLSFSLLLSLCLHEHSQKHPD
jgi:hypothetical protein